MSLSDQIAVSGLCAIVRTKMVRLRGRKWFRLLSKKPQRPPSGNCNSHTDVVNSSSLKYATKHINILPPEILGEVFFFALPSNDSGYAIDNFQHEAVPVTLSQVCGYWREIALSLSILWSTFSFHGLVDGKEHCLPTRLQLWLDRSHTCPLTIHFLDKPPIYSSLILRPHFHRLRHISTFLNDATAELLLSIPLEKASSLEIIDLKSASCSPSTLEAFFRHISAFPHLHQLWCSIIPSPAPLLYSQFPRLTHLRLWCITTDECLACLSGCSMGITFLQICDLGPSTTPSTSTNKLLFFPLLSTLILRTCRGIDILPFLDNFTAPSLTSLSLDFGCLSGLNYQAIENLAVRSSCSLTSLTLRGMAKQDAVKCFELPCLRSIERLTLNKVHVNSGLLALLVYPDASSTLRDRRGVFPWLKKLSLEWCMAEDGATSTVVASRWRDKSAPSDKSGSVPATLEELEVIFRQDPCTGATCHDVDMAALTSFAKHGLALTYQLPSSTPRYQQHPADFCRNCCYHSRYPDLGPCYHPRLPYLDF